MSPNPGLPVMSAFWVTTCIKIVLCCWPQRLPLPTDLSSSTWISGPEAILSPPFPVTCFSPLPLLSVTTLITRGVSCSSGFPQPGTWFLLYLTKSWKANPAFSPPHSYMPNRMLYNLLFSSEGRGISTVISSHSAQKHVFQIDWKYVFQIEWDDVIL